MYNSAHTLVIISVIVDTIAWLSTTFRNGFSYANMFTLSNPQRKFEVDRSKWGKFMVGIVIAVACNVLFALMFTSNIETIVAVTLLNMFFLSYCLMYFVLLKEVKR